MINDNNKKFNNLSQTDIDTLFKKACEDGDLYAVKYLLTSPQLEKHADINIDEGWGLTTACKHNHLSIVKYLLSSSDLTEHADIHKSTDEALITACNYGHIEIVKYLLASSDLTEHADIKATNSSCFVYACCYGHLEVVKYLLTSPDLKEHADINTKNGGGLNLAIQYENIEVVKYLLTSPDLKEHANIYQDEEIFINVCKDNKIKTNNELLNYLIFDYQIKQTHKITHFLMKEGNEKIKDLFDKRTLYYQLNEILENSDTKKVKIKI